MVPDWADDLAAGGGDAPPADGSMAVDVTQPASAHAPALRPPQPTPLAPKARFRDARRQFGGFARTGNAREMRRGLGHYVRSGYGGSQVAVRRFSATTSAAGRLFGALSSIAAGSPATRGGLLDPALLAGRSAWEVIDAVIEAVRPVDGTQDAEAGRMAIRDALTELLTRFPDADLLNLTAEERTFAIERYSAIDVYRRFELDLGMNVQEKAPNATVALSRLKQVREYIKETVAAAFRKLRATGQTVTAGSVERVVRDALRETFRVFEGDTE